MSNITAPTVRASRDLDQDIVWVDECTGRAHSIANMTHQHRINVMRHLIENVDSLYMEAVHGTLEALNTDATLGVLDRNTDLLAYRLTGGTIADMQPNEWLESTPMMRTLRKLTPASIDPES